MRYLTADQIDDLASGATARELDDLLHPEDARFPLTGDPLSFLGDET